MTSTMTDDRTKRDSETEKGTVIEGDTRSSGTVNVHAAAAVGGVLARRTVGRSTGNDMATRLVKVW